MRSKKLVLVEGDTARRARLRRVMRTRAASRTVAWILVDQARRLASNGVTPSVERALEWARTAGGKVDRAVRDTAALVVGDTHGEVPSIDEGDVEVVQPIRGGKGELGECSRRNPRSRVRVAN
jgi:hypothetical protein